MAYARRWKALASVICRVYTRRNHDDGKRRPCLKWRVWGFLNTGMPLNFSSHLRRQPAARALLINSKLARCRHDGEGGGQMHVTAVSNGQRLGQGHARQHLNELLRVSFRRRRVSFRIDAQEAVKSCAAPLQLQRAGMAVAQKRQQPATCEMRFLAHFRGGGGGDVWAAES